MIFAPLGTALLAPLVRWRVGLVALAIVGIPLLLPFVILQLSSAFILTRGARFDVDPVMVQHIMWIMGSPEVVILILGVWVLFFGPWVIGIWGASTARSVRLWIGWERYVRYLVVLCIVGLVSSLDRVIWGVLGDVSVAVQLGATAVTDLAALYVFLRFVPAGRTIRRGDTLHILTAWRDSATDRRRVAGLAVTWLLLGIVISVLAQVLAVFAGTAISGAATGQSTVALMLVLGAPGLITGLAMAYTTIVSVALFWTLADEVDA